jgi:uncharacterized membrane protein
VLVVAVILFVLAAIAVTVGGLGLTGTLPGNRVFGVHTRAAVVSEEAFRTANRVSAPTTIVAGGLLAVGGVAALLMGPLVGTVVAVVAAGTALFAAGSGASLGARAAEAMRPADEVGDCGQSCTGCALKDACATRERV